MLGHAGSLPHVQPAPPSAKTKAKASRGCRLTDGLSRNALERALKDEPSPTQSLERRSFIPTELDAISRTGREAPRFPTKLNLDTLLTPSDVSSIGASIPPMGSVSPSRRAPSGFGHPSPPSMFTHGGAHGRRVRKPSADAPTSPLSDASSDGHAYPSDFASESHDGTDVVHLLARSATRGGDAPEREVAQQIQHIERALDELRALNQKRRVACAGVQMVDASTQYEAQPSGGGALDRSAQAAHSLLALNTIPVPTTTRRVSQRGGGGGRRGCRRIRETLCEGTGEAAGDVYRRYQNGSMSPMSPMGSKEGGSAFAKASVAKPADQHIAPPLYAVLSEMNERYNDLNELADMYLSGITSLFGGPGVYGAHLYTCLGAEVLHYGTGRQATTHPQGVGIVGFASKAQHILVLSDPTTHRCYDPSIDVIPTAEEKQATWFFIPLRLGDRTLGVAVVYATRITPEQAAAVEVLTLHLMGPMFLHHPDMARLDISTSILGAVGDLTEHMFEDKKLVDRVVQSSKRLLNAERCSLFFVDEKAQQLVTNIEGDEVRISLNSGIAGFVAVTGKGENIRNAYSDPRFNRAVDKKTGYTTREILCMPLKLDGKVIAVAQLVNKRDRVPFSAFDEEVFQTYSSFAAVALRNCKIHSKAQRAKDWNSVLLKFASELGDMTLDDAALRTRIVGQALKLVQARRGSILVADWEAAKLRGEVDGVPVELPINAGITGACVLSGQCLNVTDPKADPRYDPHVDQVHTSDGPPDTLLCMPIRFQHKVIAVAQLAEKTLHAASSIPRGRPQFTQTDEVAMESLCVLAGVAMGTSMQYKAQMREKEMFRDMLSVVANLMEFDIRYGRDALASLIANDIRVLVGKCEQVNIFGIEGLACTGILGEAASQDDASVDRRQLCATLSRSFVKSREPIFLQNTATDTHALWPADKHPGVRSVIMMPIVTSKDRRNRANIFAVVQVLNSVGGFGEHAQQRLTYYLHLVAQTMRNIALLEFEKKNEKNAMELIALSSHVSPSLSSLPSPKGAEEQRTQQTRGLLLDVKSQSVQADAIKSFQFDCFSASDSLNSQLAHILYMFNSLGLLEPLCIDEAALLSFIVAIAVKYRKVPYHNFTHAFDVTQAVYALLFIVGHHHFTPLELFTVLLCGLCHDVDHMGVSNSYHYVSETPLGILSNATGASSPLEVHHCNVMLTKLQEHNLLQQMPREEQVAAHKLAIALILATDMAKHKSFCEDLQKMTFDGKDEESRRLALMGLFKYADISNTARPFEVAERWGMRVVEEFHSQGDKEKEQFGHVSMSYYDRDHAENAKIQSDFIRFVCEPFLSHLLRVWPDLYTVNLQLKANRAEWEKRLTTAAAGIPTIAVSDDKQDRPQLVRAE